MGHTRSMKTAVSIPDPLFHEADLVAERLQISRSKLYARALSAFLASQDEDPVTAQLNAVADAMAADSEAERPEPGLTEARAAIEKGDWQW